ncbi:MAG: Calx-beta domain-containing protein, partial [Pyrinomonadaceae bacterium]
VVSVTGNIVGAIIKLNGADNVTIDGRIGGVGTNRDLTVSNSSTSAATAAIWLASVAAGNGASNNTIRNLELAGGTDTSASANSTFGIIMCGTTISTTANGVDNDNNAFIANRIVKVRYGIVTRGTTTDLNINPVVTDNIVGPNAFGTDQINKVGIFMQADTGALVSRNTIQFVGCLDPQACSGADRMGIGIGQESWSMTPGTLTSNNYTVTRNVIHDIVEETTFSSVGINLATTGGTTNNLVANNFIYNVRANGTVGDQAVGLGIAGGLGDRVVFNSISMTGDVDPGVSTATSNFGSGIRVGNASGATHGNLTLSNNSVYMDLSSTSTAAARYYAISGNAAGYNWGTGGENHNNYYINPINTQLQTGGLGTVSGNTLTTQFATLANWQTAYTTPAAQDANSIQADPQHVSTTGDLHIAVASPNVDAGLSVVGVTRDIDNQSRVAAPDIGADEPSGVTPPANDIETTLIIAPANSAVFTTGATSTPQARFTNVGSATQTSRQVTFTITGPGGYNYSNMQTIPSIAVDEAVNVIFATTPAFAMAGTYTMTASTAADSNTANDSAVGTFSVVAPFNGSYNVGTAETFTSLTNPGGIFAGINSAGATGNITINITSDLAGETGAVALNEIAGGFTVLIKPTGAARTISGAAPAAGGLLGFSSTDGVTIDGSLSAGTDRSLTIIPSNAANNGGGIYFASGANGTQNNVVKNVNVYGNGSTTGVLLGVAFAGSTFGGLGVDNDNNRIENCDIRGAFYGIASLGASAANKDTGTVITKNIMSGTGATGIGRVGIYIIFADGAEITQNNIASVSNPGSVDTIGIAAGSQGLSSTPLATGGISNATISRNYVGVVSNNATFSSAGIVVASDTTGTNNVVNNMVTGVTGNANAGDIVAGIYVNGLAGSTQNIYHNSVSMTGDRLPVTANMLPSYALAIATDQPTNVVNNVLVNSQTRTGSTGGGGESYAIGFDGPAANVNLLSNTNDLFVSGPIGVVGITGDLTTAAQTTTAGTGTNQATLVAWQTATTEDGASISADPLFTSTTDLHIPAGSPLVNIGTDVMVTTDFDGQTRDAMRDIGADEFVLVVPGTLAFSSATYSGGEAGSPFTVTVNRTGGTDGSVTVDYATSNGTATGGAACTAGVDYINTSGTLTFANGVSSQTFNVTICDDAVVEGNETINYTLTNATGGATIGSPSSAVQTIVDNDVAAGAFSVNDVKVTEGNAGPVNAIFTVTYTGGAAASVSFATANRTATVGTDYATNSGTLNFPALSELGGSSTQTVTVVVNGDTNKEPNETFYLNLSGATGGATISDNQGVGTIVDEDRAYVNDFDDDLKSDFSVFRPSDQIWYILPSASGVPSLTSFGLATDRPTPGDYDGDGKTDIAFYRASNSAWHILKSSTNTVAVWIVGQVGDKPVQGDYNGDGTTDMAIFRPSNGLWSAFFVADGSSTSQLFGISTDRPVQGDYDGDGKTDPAVYRDGTWYVLRSSDSSVGIQNWGTATDKPVSGDFGGDGQTDLAIYRNGQWWVLDSLTGASSVVAWGLATDIAVPADYDGDGTTDVAIFRPSDGDWYVLRSSTLTIQGIHWGLNGDFPIPAGNLPQ